MSRSFGPARALGPADVGFRVVVRRQLPSGLATDILGLLLSLDSGHLVIRRPDGADVRIDAGSVLAAKRVPPGPARIRPARPGDADAIEALRGAYLDAMPAGLADSMARRPELLADQVDVFQYVAEPVGTQSVVGWVAGGPSRDEDRSGATHGEVYGCYVAPEWSGVGLAGRLLRRLLSQLAADGRNDVSLWVLAGDEPARRFYASHGSTPDGEQRTLDYDGPVVEIRCVRR